MLYFQLPVDNYTAEVLHKAADDLARFKHQRLVRALKIQPDGVPLMKLNNEFDGETQLNDPLVVAPAIKASQAIMYCIEKREYRLQTRAHRTALVSYNPPDARMV